MRKVLMMVVTALVVLGTNVTAKAASLLKVSDVGISKNNDNSLVLKHANQLFENIVMASPQHSSHSSHSSHDSHASHASHYSSNY